MGRVSRNALFLLLSVAFEAGAQTRDSTGIQIVESKAPALAAGRAWRVDPKPLLVLGDPMAPTEGDSLYEFSRVMGLSRVSSGLWAIGLPTSVRFFDAGGKYVRTAGRSGEGPGELRQNMGMRSMRGDTLVLTDLGEVEYFSSDGKAGPQGASRRSVAGIFIYPQGVLGDGSYVGLNWNDRATAYEGRATRRLPLIRVSRDGLKFDTLAIVTAGEIVGTGRPGMERNVTYAANAMIAARDARILFSYPVRAEVTEYSNTWRATRIARLDLKPRQVTSADQDDYRNWMLNLPGEDGRPVPERLRAQRATGIDLAGFASTFPIHDLMLVDAAGHAWLRRFDVRHTRYKPGPVSTITADTPGTWDILDPSGRWLTTLTTPARFTPLDIGTDYVAGIAHNADDVEMIHVYRLIKP